MGFCPIFSTIFCLSTESDDGANILCLCVCRTGRRSGVRHKKPPPPPPRGPRGVSSKGLSRTSCDNPLVEPMRAIQHYECNGALVFTPVQAAVYSLALRLFFDLTPSRSANLVWWSTFCRFRGISRSLTRSSWRGSITCTASRGTWICLRRGTGLTRMALSSIAPRWRRTSPTGLCR